MVPWAGGRDGPARSFSRLQLIASRSQMERKVLLEPPILRTGATWASSPRHASSGALLQGQAPAVRMDYKQDALTQIDVMEEAVAGFLVF